MKKKVESGKTYLGVVVDNNDPDRQGRLKIKVMDIFEDVKDEDLPWATPWKDLNGNQFNLPEKGKVMIVVFDHGDVNKPEFIFSDHYNVNLENKIKALSQDDYLSMKSLIYDHRTQIYVNESEGLKIDHKYNNINIKENSINLNIKDNKRSVNIGDETANQQMILGNHWMDWFDEFVDHLMGQFGGAFLSPTTCMPNPTFVPVLLKYKALRNPVFLSHHVNVIDNNKSSTVKSEAQTRQDEPQQGDNWVSTKEENKITTKTDENFKPQPGEKPKYDEGFKASVTENVTPIVATPSNVINPATGTPDKPEIPSNPIGETSISNTVEPVKKPEPLTSQKSNKEIDRLINFLKSKDYTIYEDSNILNIVGVRNKKNKITNVFDEKMKVFFRDSNLEWQLFDYDITTVPGLVPGEELLPENVNILVLGQYADSLRIGFLQDNPNHKCLLFQSYVVHKNRKRNKYDFKSPIEQVLYQENSNLAIHRSSKTSTQEYVFHTSEGSQVFKNITHYEQFMKLCQSQIDLGKKDIFTYTLIDKTELEASTIVGDDDVKVNKFEKYIGSGTASYLSKAKAKAKQAKDYKDKKTKQAQDFLNTQKEKIGDKTNDSKYKIEGLKTIATLKIEGYLKDENNPDEGKILTEKVNSGAILRRSSWDDGNKDITYDTYEGLQNSYRNRIPNDVKSKDNYSVLIKLDKGQFVATLVEFLPKPPEDSSTDGARPSTETTTQGDITTIVGFGNSKFDEDMATKEAEKEAENKIKLQLGDKELDLNRKNWIRKDLKSFQNKDGSFDSYVTYEYTKI